MARICSCVASAAVALVLPTVLACNGQVGGAPSGSGDPDNTMVGESDVVSVTQRSALSFAEAVVIEPNDAFAETCSGVVIAPRVVLTAAHCIVFVPGKSWRVTAPFSMGGAETHTARDGEPMDAAFRNVSRTDYAARELRDVGVLYLDAPFANLKMPTLAPGSLAVEKSAPPIFVSAVGRSNRGAADGLALSTPTMLDAPAGSRALIAYETARVTAPGESGGPLFIEGTHHLIGVHAHVDASTKTDAWARLDGDVYTWITQKVASHGGWDVSAPR